MIFVNNFLMLGFQLLFENCFKNQKLSVGFISKLISVKS